MHVLVIEPDRHERSLLEGHFRACGWEVSAVENVEASAAVLDNKRIDVVLLEFDRNHCQLSQRLDDIRAFKRSTNRPVLVRSRFIRPEDIVKSLDAGADDYMPKPNEVGLVQRKLVALHRRHQGVPFTNTEHITDRMVIDHSEKKVFIDGADIQLVGAEYPLMKEWMRHRGRFSTLPQLAEELHLHSEKELEYGIHRIRLKIDRALGRGVGKKIIESQRGWGFRIPTYEELVEAGVARKMPPSRAAEASRQQL